MPSLTVLNEATETATALTEDAPGLACSETLPCSENLACHDGGVSLAILTEA